MSWVWLAPIRTAQLLVSGERHEPLRQMEVLQPAGICTAVLWMRKLSTTTPVFVTRQWFSIYGSPAGPVWMACDSVNVKLACAEPQYNAPKRTRLPRLQWRRVPFTVSQVMTVVLPRPGLRAGRCGFLSRDESSEAIRAPPVGTRLDPHCARRPRIGTYPGGAGDALWPACRG